MQCPLYSFLGLSALYFVRRRNHDCGPQGAQHCSRRRMSGSLRPHGAQLRWYEPPGSQSGTHKSHGWATLVCQDGAEPSYFFFPLLGRLIHARHMREVRRGASHVSSDVMPRGRRGSTRGMFLRGQWGHGAVGLSATTLSTGMFALDASSVVRYESGQGPHWGGGGDRILR